jgi:hypothetical protein
MCIFVGLKYTLFENGIDSFKAAYDSIEKIKDLYDGGYHHYKDAIRSICQLQTKITQNRHLYFPH